MSNQVNLNVNEVKDFLKHIIKTNQVLQKSGKKPTAVEIIGDSGMGKTSAALQLAEELNLTCVKLNLSQIEELGDLVGFPVKQYEMANQHPDTKEYEKFWVDETLVPEALSRGSRATNKSRMSYAAPEWIAGKEEGGILILDDYNRADQRFLQACMELIDRQSYISWSLPKNWHILLTCNPDNGDYLVNSVDSAQKTRYISVNLKYDKKCWAQWAEQQGIDGRCINFLLMHEELITKDVNPRSITTFFNTISTIEDFSKEIPLIQMLGEGSVGNEFATMFTTFINHKLDKLISPEEMLLGKDSKLVFSKFKSAVGSDKDYRADIASVLCTRFINYTLLYANESKGPISQDVLDRVIDFGKSNLITNDIQYYMIREIFAGNKQKFQKLLMDDALVDVVTM